MGEEDIKKVEAESPQEKAPNDDPSQKSQLLSIKKDLSFKVIGESIDRDASLARVEIEKKFALIKAWEDSEKTKADNKASKKLSSIGAWENTKIASVEAQLKQIEEHFKKMKAAYVEKMQHRMAEIHKSAEEKRAVVEAKRGEDTVKVEDAAAKFRATGKTPKKIFERFSQ